MEDWQKLDVEFLEKWGFERVSYWDMFSEFTQEYLAPLIRALQPDMLGFGPGHILFEDGNDHTEDWCLQHGMDKIKENDVPETFTREEWCKHISILAALCSIPEEERYP